MDRMWQFKRTAVQPENHLLLGNREINIHSGLIKVLTFPLCFHKSPFAELCPLAACDCAGPLCAAFRPLWCLTEDEEKKIHVGWHLPVFRNRLGHRVSLSRAPWTPDSYENCTVHGLLCPSNAQRFSECLKGMLPPKKKSMKNHNNKAIYK